jgi:16S rRNA (cytidine1402-2'-O)-methyltransferase
VQESVAQLDGLIAESEKAGRHFLLKFKIKHPIRQMPIKLLNEHTTPEQVEALIQEIPKEQIWGVVSDAGVPCLADPGAALVRLARWRGMEVKAIAGPSSIVLALMLSGLPAQRFAFHGYLDRERKGHLEQMQRRSKQESATQLFLETPYRNQETFKVMLETLHVDTLVSVACELTQPSEYVATYPVAKWRQVPAVDLHKHPTLFSLFAGIL